MKGIEMLFQIISRFCDFVVVASGEGIKIHRKRYDQKNRKSRGILNDKRITLMQYLLQLHHLFLFFEFCKNLTF